MLVSPSTRGFIMFNVTDTEFGLLLRAKRENRSLGNAQALVNTLDDRIENADRQIAILTAMLETERGLRMKAEDTLDRILKMPISRLN